MLNKLKDILEFPFTPIASIVVMGIADSVLRTTGADTIHFMICLILTAAAVISTLMNIAFYGKAMKIVTLSLCLVAVLFMFSEFRKPDIQQTAPAGYSSSSYTYQNHEPVSFGSGGESTKRGIFDNTCTACNGSKKCHVCNGKGDFYCNGMYCLRGQCTSCKGTGLYDHGSYVSKCLTCRGDGICDICDGSNRYDCSICHGSGKCTHCR